MNNKKNTPARIIKMEGIRFNQRAMNDESAMNQHTLDAQPYLCQSMTNFRHLMRYYIIMFLVP